AIRTRLADEARAREDAERARANEMGQELHDAISAAGVSGVREILGPRSVNEAVSYMQHHGDYEVRGRRRSRRGGEHRVTYTMRGPNGETMKLTGGLSFGSGPPLSDIKIEANPQAGR